MGKWGRNEESKTPFSNVFLKAASKHHLFTYLFFIYSFKNLSSLCTCFLFFQFSLSKKLLTCGIIRRTRILTLAMDKIFMSALESFWEWFTLEATELYKFILVTNSSPNKNSVNLQFKSLYLLFFGLNTSKANGPDKVASALRSCLLHKSWDSNT